MGVQLKMIFYRGDGGITKTFVIQQNKVGFDLTTITSPTVRWHLIEPDGTKRFVDWDGTPTGSNNEEANFDLADDFFNKTVEYRGQIEVFEDGVLVMHNQEIFIVDVREPVGLHT